MPWQLISKGLNEPGTAPASVDEAESLTFVERFWRLLGLHTLPRSTPGLNSVAFTIALISLSAKLAKADGVAVRIEAETFERLHRASPSDRANIRRIYDLAAGDATGFQRYADKISALLADNKPMLRDVLDGLLHIAVADGILHHEEDRHLRIAAASFNIAADEYQAMRAVFVHDPTDPYMVLGLPRSIDTIQLKAHYRKLVRENHPDALSARGVPNELVDIANRKLASINAAYDQIKHERGL